MVGVHFPDSKLIDDSYDNRQGHLNLGKCRRITNRGNRNLAKRVNNQSKIRWALAKFKPFKSAETDGIVLALLHKG
jgi:ribosomal protein S6